MKYIDADKLKAEIDRLYVEHSSKYENDDACQVLDYLEDFIDSLQQEQSCEDLEEEEEIEKYMDIRGLIWYDDINLSDFAHHFYELGKQSREPVNEGLEEAAENYIAPIENDEGLDYINFNGRDIKDAFIAGAEWQKQQMLKMLKEADKWLKEHINDYIVKGRDIDLMFDDFIKAMEEKK